MISSSLVYVFVWTERSVFASCPHEFAGCTEEVPLSVTAGESAMFNATVIHTPGGSCDFMQDITSIKLRKINEQFGVSNMLLFSCDTYQGAVCVINNHRLSLNRGRDPGLEFVFSLNNTVHNSDAGLYEVTVEGTNPVTNSLSTLTKRFRLEVTPGEKLLQYMIWTSKVC